MNLLKGILFSEIMILSFTGGYFVNEKKQNMQSSTNEIFQADYIPLYYDRIPIEDIAEMWLNEFNYYELTIKDTDWEKYKRMCEIVNKRIYENSKPKPKDDGMLLLDIHTD